MESNNVNNNTNNTVSPYTIAKIKHPPVPTQDQNINTNLTTNNNRHKLSPYEVADLVNNNSNNNNNKTNDIDDHLNQKYSPPFLSELKLEEYQNIKNEQHHQQISQNHGSSLEVNKSISTNNNNNGLKQSKKRPLNTTEANITPEYICALIKQPSNNNNTNNNNKLDGGGVDPPQSVSKKR